jgi:hypothetical protein
MRTQRSGRNGCGLTIGCSGCGAGHVFVATKVLRGGPAPLTLGALGRWASIAAAAGDLSRGCRVFHPGSSQAASRRTTSRVRDTSAPVGWWAPAPHP